MTMIGARSLRLRRFRRFSFLCGARSPRFSTARRKPSARFSSTNIGRAPESAGIETRRRSTKSSACRCLHPAHCAFAARRARRGTERRSRPSHARLICFRGLRARSGNIVFPLSTGFAIRLPCGRWLPPTKVHSPPCPEWRRRASRRTLARAAPRDLGRRSIWVFLALAVLRRKPLFEAIGLSWISLDSLVRIETFQWVTRDFREKFFPRTFSLSGGTPGNENRDRGHAETQDCS